MPAFNLPQGTAYIVITALTGTMYTLLAFCVRLFIRLKMNPPFGWDDIHCTIATIFTVIDASLVMIQTGYGLGHHSDTLSSAIANTQRILGWVTVICFVQATCFSMLSVTFLLMRVTQHTTRARPAYFAALATVLWCLTSTIIICFQCRMPEPWRTRPHSRCIDIYSAWQFITISRSLLETGNVVIAACLLWKLRMPLRPKLSIVAMFSLRLLVIPPALTRLHYLHISWRSADWSYARINVQIITQVCLHTSTILATVPCVKNFLLVFESGNLHSRAQPTVTSSRRISRRRSSISAVQSTTSPLSQRPRLDISRRAISGFDMRHAPHCSAIRPGPLHTLRMNSWSSSGLLSTRAPSIIDTVSSDGLGGGTKSRTTLSTAEHDPEDARYAAWERRKSMDSEKSRKRIKRTHSVIVDFQDQRARSAEQSVRRRSSGMDRLGMRTRTSVGSCWSWEGALQVKEDRDGDC